MLALLTILGVLAFLLLVPFCAVCFVFWLWMLIHAIRNDHLDGTARVIWVLVVWFLPVVGPVIYFFCGRTVGHRRLTMT